MSQEARERNRFIKKYLLEKIWLYVLFLALLLLIKGSKICIYLKKSGFMDYVFLVSCIFKSVLTLDDKLFTSNLPLIRYHNSSCRNYFFFQIFLPTPNVKVPVVPTGQNSYHGWMTVCSILSHKIFGATLKV